MPIEYISNARMRDSYRESAQEPTAKQNAVENCLPFAGLIEPYISAEQGHKNNSNSGRLER